MGAAATIRSSNACTQVEIRLMRLTGLGIPQEVDSPPVKIHANSSPEVGIPGFFELKITSTGSRNS